MKSQILILMLSVLTLSCSEDDNLQKKNVEFVQIADGFLFGDGAEGISQENMVITSETDWDNLKSKMNTVNSETDNFSETEIDFSKFRVIASFGEILNEGNYKVEITKVSQTTKGIIVSIERKPLSNPNSIKVINQPYFIIKIPVNELPIVFESIN